MLKNKIYIEYIMVKLVGDDTIEEIESYFDYETNFPQLLEDYLHKSGEVQAIINKSKSKDHKKVIKNMKYQLKTLYEKGDHDKPRMKQFKTWMDSKCEQKLMKHNKKDKDLEKDELIRNLKNELLKKDKSITNLKNENYQHRKKINKLKKKIKDMEQVEVKPEPEPSHEPSPELFKRMDPDYDSDDDIVENPPPQEETKSIYSNHLTQQEEKEKDEYEQKLKAENERISIQRQEHIQWKEEKFKLQDKFMEKVFQFNFDKYMKNIMEDYYEGETTTEETKNLCEVKFNNYLQSEYDKISHNPLIDYPELNKKSKRKLTDWIDDNL